MNPSQDAIVRSLKHTQDGSWGAPAGGTYRKDQMRTAIEAGLVEQRRGLGGIVEFRLTDIGKQRLSNLKESQVKMTKKQLEAIIKEAVCRQFSEQSYDYRSKPKTNKVGDSMPGDKKDPYPTLPGLEGLNDMFQKEAENVMDDLFLGKTIYADEMSTNVLNKLEQQLGYIWVNDDYEDNINLTRRGRLTFEKWIEERSKDPVLKGFDNKRIREVINKIVKQQLSEQSYDYRSKSKTNKVGDKLPWHKPKKFPALPGLEDLDEKFQKEAEDVMDKLFIGNNVSGHSVSRIVLYNLKKMKYVYTDTNMFVEMTDKGKKAFEDWLEGRVKGPDLTWNDNARIREAISKIVREQLAEQSNMIGSPSKKYNRNLASFISKKIEDAVGSAGSKLPQYTHQDLQDLAGMFDGIYKGIAPGNEKGMKKMCSTYKNTLKNLGYDSFVSDVTKLFREAE